MKHKIDSSLKSLVVINILSCVLLLALPLVLSSRNDNFSWLRYLDAAVVVAAHIAIFYVNLLWLIDAPIFRRRQVLFYVVNVLLIVAVAVALNVWHVWYYTDIVITSNRPAPEFNIYRTLRDCLSLVLTVGLAVAIKMTSRWQRSEREKSEMSAAVSEAELKNLKNQLNPHFLFNTLNNIYSLMEVDQARAQQSLLELSRILRYVLYDDNAKRVPLDKELSFTRSYIELMSLRLTARTHLTVEIEEHPGSLQIAPLLFISLVENAFKHGVSQTEESMVDINIALEGSTVACVVKNSLFPKEDNDYSGSGIGIENLRRRLSLIYPDRHRFTVRVLKRVYIAELFVDLD